MGQLMLAKRQQQEIEAAQAAKSKPAPKPSPRHKRPGSAAAAPQEDENGNLTASRPATHPASPRKADYTLPTATDVATRQNLQDINAIAEKRHEKETEKEKRAKAQKDQRDKNRSVALAMTTAKFGKDFDQVMADMKESEDWTEESRISFEQAGSILATLGFLPENITPEKPDYALFEELWKMLEGEK